MWHPENAATYSRQRNLCSFGHFPAETHMCIVHMKVLLIDKGAQCDAPFAITVSSPCVLALK